MLDHYASLGWDVYDLPPSRSHLKLLPKDTQEELPLDAPVVPVFKGKTYDASQDEARLATALGRIKAALGSGEKFTLKQLATLGSCSEAGASARVRDLRRLYKMHIVSERVRGGLWWYYAVIP